MTIAACTETSSPNTGLVRDDELGVAGERTGDGDALLLAAGQLARHAFGKSMRQAHDLEEASDGLRDVFSWLFAQALDRAANGVADCMAWIERAVRVLEYHLHSALQHAIASVRRPVREFDVAEAEDAVISRLKAGQHFGEGGLPRARLCRL